MRISRLLTVAAATALLLTGCSVRSEDTASSGESTPTATAAALLARFDLPAGDPVGLVDRLDRLGGEDRPADLKVSVRPHELQLAAGDESASLPLPEDRFYLSVAPYVDETHDCFYHSLTTCQGELGGEEVQVRITDETDGTVLFDGTRTTFANGFVGFWLPRDIEGTIEVTHDGHTGTAEIATDDDAPTCLTTLQLA